MAMRVWYSGPSSDDFGLRIHVSSTPVSVPEGRNPTVRCEEHLQRIGASRRALHVCLLTEHDDETPTPLKLALLAVHVSRV